MNFSIKILIILIFCSCLRNNGKFEKLSSDNDHVASPVSCLVGDNSSQEEFSEVDCEIPDTQKNRLEDEELFTLAINQPSGGRIYSSDLSFDCGDMSMTQNKCSLEISSGKSVHLLYQAKSGYTFQSWNGACQELKACRFIMEESIDVGAHFSEDLIVSQSTPNLYSNGFESGDLSNAPLNNFNFRFHDSVSVSLVSGGIGEKSVIYPSVITVNDSRDWTAFEGANSMRFRYVAGRAMTEIKASWDSQPILWIRYKVRVPKNYYHSNSGPGNNKFMALWQDKYEFNSGGSGATITTQLRGSGGGSANISFYHIKSIDPNDVNSYRLGGDQQVSGDFISVPEDRGRWMTIVYKVVPSSSYSAKDGSMEMWRRWEGEQEYVKFFSYLNVDKMNAPTSMPNGFAHGYFQGWANSAYTEVTEWLYDNFEFSSQSLL